MKARTATEIPSGVADQTGRVGGVESNFGLLDLIDLLKGERIVLSETPMVPLFLSGQALSGQALSGQEVSRPELLVHKREPTSNAHCVDRLQISPGRLQMLWTVTLPLPEWALDGSSIVSLKAAQYDGTFQILWSAHRPNTGGIPRARGYELREAGLIEIDEETGALTATEQREPALIDAQEAYALALKLDLIPVRMGPNRIETPWPVEGREVVLTRRGIGGDRGLFLRYLGNEQDAREVALPNYKNLDPIVTMDGRTLLLYDGRAWNLFSTWDGTQQGRLALEEDVAEVAIIDSLVLYARDEEEVNAYQLATRRHRDLCARDLQSGELLWSYALYDKKLDPDPRTYPGGAPDAASGAPPPTASGPPFETH